MISPYMVEYIGMSQCVGDLRGESTSEVVPLVGVYYDISTYGRVYWDISNMVEYHHIW
jgi:hypothetical protein